MSNWTLRILPAVLTIFTDKTKSSAVKNDYIHHFKEETDIILNWFRTAKKSEMQKLVTKIANWYSISAYWLYWVRLWLSSLTAHQRHPYYYQFKGQSDWLYWKCCSDAPKLNRKVWFEIECGNHHLASLRKEAEEIAAEAFRLNLI